MESTEYNYIDADQIAAFEGQISAFIEKSFFAGATSPPQRRKDYGDGNSPRPHRPKAS